MLIFFLLIFPYALFAQPELKCQSSYDHLHIPHVSTNSLQEYYYCFGFFHGKDRAWEMDYFRRVAQSKNAEVYGFSHLKSDLMMTLLDFPRQAANLWKNTPQDKRQWLEAYAEGVNAGFKTGKLAREFQDLNYLPEPWLPEDTYTVLLLQSFDQTRKAFTKDHEEEVAREHWKEKAENLFSEENVPWENNILKEGEYPKQGKTLKKTSQKENQFKLWSDFPSVFGEESGSNNWVINKKKSKSGYAILANDPHLDLKTPLFWYWIHLKSPKGNVIGASLPGVPIVVSGTNGKVAWGLTNAYINTADAVYLKNPPADYIQSFRPTVKVKIGPWTLPFFFKSFEKTITGLPVLPLDVESEDKIVLKWTGFSLSPEKILPMFDILHVNNVKEMQTLLKSTDLPAWNYVFADTSGEIGFQVVGKAYKHEERTPFGISALTPKELSAEEFLDPDERPGILNPSRNYIYTANNRHWPSDARYYGGRAYSYSFRGLRIDELLKGKQDVGSFQKIQCDRQVVDARFFIPLIQKYLNVEEFRDWNLEADEDTYTTSLYRRFMDILMEEWKVNEYALYRLLEAADTIKTQELKKALTQARKEIKNKKWSELHRISFKHLSKNGEWTFAPELAGVGDTHSVNPGTAKWDPDRQIYEQYSGASMRMIIEMKKNPEIWLTLPGLNRNYTGKPDPKNWLGWKNCLYQKIDY
jgi:penicillin G amidase